MKVQGLPHRSGGNGDAHRRSWSLLRGARLRLMRMSRVTQQVPPDTRMHAEKEIPGQCLTLSSMSSFCQDSTSQQQVSSREVAQLLAGFGSWVVTTERPAESWLFFCFYKFKLLVLWFHGKGFVLHVRVQTNTAWGRPVCILCQVAKLCRILVWSFFTLLSKIAK